MTSSHADVTGLMVKPIPNWQPRVDALCHPEQFHVHIEFSNWDKLTITERKRLATKLEMVEEFASYMAAGMLKGTIKYPLDGYSLAQWIAHLIGEGADQANYQILLANAFWEKQKEIATQDYEDTRG